MSDWVGCISSNKDERDEAEGDITHFIDVSRVSKSTALAMFGKQSLGHAMRQLTGMFVYKGACGCFKMIYSSERKIDLLLLIISLLEQSKKRARGGGLI